MKNKQKILLAAVSFFVLFLLNIKPVMAQTIGNIQNENIQILTPDPRISIPGVTDLDQQEINSIIQRNSSGGLYLSVPFLSRYISNGYKYAISLAAVLSILMIIIAGFEWALSGGNQDSIGKSKKRIGNAVTGLIIALLSYSLLYSINPDLVQFRSLSITYLSGEPENFDRGIPLSDESYSQIVEEVRPISKSQESSSVLKTKNKFIKYLKEKNIEVNPSLLDLSSNKGNCPLVNKNLIKIDRKSYPKVYDESKNIKLRCDSTKGMVERKSGSESPLPRKSESALKEIFNRYSPCLGGINPVIFEALSHVESMPFLNQNSCQGTSGFLGLFQTTPYWCRKILDRFELSYLCTDGDDIPAEVYTKADGKTYTLGVINGRNHLEERKKNQTNTSLLDPEISTMVATSLMLESFEIIYKNCKNINNDYTDSEGTAPKMISEDLYFLIYTGHHDGTGSLRSKIRQAGQKCSLKFLSK